MKKKKTDNITPEAAAEITENTAAVTEKPKRKFNTKKLKYGTLSIVVTIIVVAVVVLLNVIAGVLAERNNLTVDLTPAGFYEISDKTKEYLDKVTQDIDISVMAEESQLNTDASKYYKQAYEILRKYPQTNPRIKLQFVDLAVEPQYANRYRDSYAGSIETGTVVVSLLDDSGNPVRTKVNAINDLFNMEMNYQTYQYEIVSSKAEQVLTSDIMYVTDVDPKKAYIMEIEAAEPYSAANIEVLLSDNGFEVGTWDPATTAIPEDMDLLIIDNPLNDFNDKLIDDIYNFLENGGSYGKNMVYLANSNQKETPNINNFLKEWGMSIRQGVYIGETDPQNQLSAQTAYWFKTNVVSNGYTSAIANIELPVSVFAANPIDILFANQGNVTVVDLLDTADTAFIMTDEFNARLTEDPNAEPDTGTFCVMALSNKYTFIENKQILSNVLVYGSSEMLASTSTQSSYYSNADYFISAINSMTGKTAGIVIAPKKENPNTFEATLAKYNTANIVFLIALPLTVLIVGAVIILRRRHK